MATKILITFMRYKQHKSRIKMILIEEYEEEKDGDEEKEIEGEKKRGENEERGGGGTRKTHN